MLCGWRRCSCQMLALESTTNFESIGRGYHVQYCCLDIDDFICNRLPIDLDDMTANLEDLVLGLGIKDRTLNMLTRIFVPNWCFLRLHTQVGRND